MTYDFRIEAADTATMYRDLASALKGLVGGEPDPIANMANAVALIWETLVGSYVPGAQTLSIQQWSLAITEQVVGADAEQLGVTSAVSLAAAIPLLLVLIVGSTWYAGWRLRTLRLTSDE